MTRPFRRAADTPRLTREEADRQGRASRLAFEALRDTPAVIAFLNTHQPEIGGRPIDVAITSDDGLLMVERHLVTLKA